MTSKRSKNLHRFGFMVPVMSAVIFGLWPPSTRAVYANGGNVAFMIIATTWARGLALAIFCALTHKPLFRTRKDIRNALTGGFFQAVSSLGFVAALAFLPGPLVIIIGFTHTLMLLFFMAWRREIKLDTITLATTIVALAGLTLVLDVWHTHSNAYLIGAALTLAAAVATVSRLYVYGHQTKTRNFAVVGAENFLVAGLCVIFVAAFQTPHAPVTAAGYAWAGVGCASLALGTFGMFFGISLLGSFRWSLFLKLEPVFTSLFSALLVNEVLKWHQYFGIAVVVGSLALYQIFDQRRKITTIEQTGIPSQ